MKKFFSDFKAFITKGNVMDLAVAVIIGAAFGTIVTSLVNDVIMPLIVWIFPVQDLSSLSVVLRPATSALANDALLWNYGKFIQAVLNFVIIAFMVFLMLKAVMGAKGFVSPKRGVTLTKEEYKALKKEGKTKAEIKAIDDEKTQEKKAAEEAKKAEAAANSTDGLLRQILDQLKDNQPK